MRLHGCESARSRRSCSSAPLWNDPKRIVFRELAKRSLTDAGLGSVGEKAAAIADYVVLDMFANVCTGREDAKGAIKNAERQLPPIYPRLPGPICPTGPAHTPPVQKPWQIDGWSRWEQGEHMQWAAMRPASSGTQASTKGLATGNVSGGNFKPAHRRRVLLGIVLTFSCHAQANFGSEPKSPNRTKFWNAGVVAMQRVRQELQATTSLARLTGRAPKGTIMLKIGVGVHLTILESLDPERYVSDS
jgi:hypothetical protein